MTSPVQEAARYLSLDLPEQEYLRDLLHEAEQRGRLAERTDPTKVIADCQHAPGDQVNVCLTCLIAEYGKLRPKTVREAVAAIGDLSKAFNLVGLTFTREGDGTMIMHWANGLRDEVDCHMDAAGLTDGDEHAIRTVRVSFAFPSRKTYQQLAVLEETDA